MIRFRALMPEDAEDVARVEYESFPTPWSREDFWREASNDFACYIVALADDSIIGFGGCWISFEEAQVTNIALTAAQRGRGLGRLLMKKLMHAAAVSLYEGLGFSAVGVRRKYYQDNDEDAILMWHTKLKEFADERCSSETDAWD